MHTDLPELQHVSCDMFYQLLEALDASLAFDSEALAAVLCI